jgi:hypothetical protein
MNGVWFASQSLCRNKVKLSKARARPQWGARARRSLLSQALIVSSASIESLNDTSQADFQDAICREYLTIVSSPRYSIHHISYAMTARESIVQFLQMSCRTRLSSDLEELNAHLPRLGVVLVEFLCVIYNDRFDIIARGSIGDHNYVEGFDVCVMAMGLSLHRVLQLATIGFEDLIETGTCRCTAEGLDIREDLLHGSLRSHIRVPSKAVTGVRVAMIQKEDVDAVSVILCANGGDTAEGFLGLSPGSACHAT